MASFKWPDNDLDGRPPATAVSNGHTPGYHDSAGPDRPARSVDAAS